MTALTLSRAEYLVILDILHADHIFGLDNRSLFPDDHGAYLELIQQGIRQLEARQLVRIEGGRHIIERRLLELGAVVTRPQVAIMTIRDRAGIGQQLYTHYLAGDKVVEQVLPAEHHYSLGQLPDINSALDRILRLLDLPPGPCLFPHAQPIDRDHLADAQARLESGDGTGALANLVHSGWPTAFAENYLAALDGRTMAGHVNVMAVVEGRPGERRDWSLIHGDKGAWLLLSQPDDHSRLVVRQIDAAAFRAALDAAYRAVSQRTQEYPRWLS